MPGQVLQKGEKKPLEQPITKLTLAILVGKRQLAHIYGSKNMVAELRFY